MNGNPAAPTPETDAEHTRTLGFSLVAAFNYMTTHAEKLERARDDAIRERDELRQKIQTDFMSGVCIELEAGRDSLREENARLKTDKERLEHALDRVGFYFAGHDDFNHISEKILKVLAGETIDAAIKESQ